MDSNTIPPTSGETNHDQAGTKAVEVIPPKPRKIFVSHATKIESESNNSSFAFSDATKSTTSLLQSPLWVRKNGTMQ